MLMVLVGLFVTLPLTVGVPPVGGMVELLVRVEAARVPKPVIWPVLERGRLLLSKVPPVREMVPALLARPERRRSLLLVETRRVPVLVRGEERVRVELPRGSMVPVL